MPQEMLVVNPRSVDAWVADYPRLVVEVLSRTTQDYDRTDKFDLYRGCAALQDYVLVSTRRQSVHVYSRGDDGVWLLRLPDQPATRHHGLCPWSIEHRAPCSIARPLLSISCAG
jgi:Uma2 family endonuclease